MQGERHPNKVRVTTPYLTKYERARVLGTRALQIRCVARPCRCLRFVRSEPSVAVFQYERAGARPTRRRNGRASDRHQRAVPAQDSPHHPTLPPRRQLRGLERVRAHQRLSRLRLSVETGCRGEVCSRVRVLYFCCIVMSSSYRIYCCLIRPVVACPRRKVSYAAHPLLRVCAYVRKIGCN